MLCNFSLSSLCKKNSQVKNRENDKHGYKKKKIFSIDNKHEETEYDKEDNTDKENTIITVVIIVDCTNVVWVDFTYDKSTRDIIKYVKKKYNVTFAEIYLINEISFYNEHELLCHFIEDDEVPCLTIKVSTNRDF